MTRLAVLAAGALGAALLVVPTAATAQQPVAPRADTFRHYAGCGVKADTPKAHQCPKKGKKGAFFESVDRDAVYKVCVKFPDGKRLCAPHQEAPEDELRVNSITSHQVGRHVVTWFVGGDQVGTWAFRITA